MTDPNDPQPSQLPRSTTIISAASTGMSISGMSYDLNAHLHGSCPNCHHYHHARTVRMHVNRKKSVDFDARCENCRHRWFSFGGMRRHFSLASQLTIPNPPSADDQSNAVCLSDAQTRAPARSDETSSKLPSHTDNGVRSHESSEASTGSTSHNPTRSEDTRSTAGDDSHSIPATASERSPSTAPGEFVTQIQRQGFSSTEHDAHATKQRRRWRSWPGRMFSKLRKHLKLGVTSNKRRSGDVAPEAPSTPNAVETNESPSRRYNDQHAASPLEDNTLSPASDHGGPRNHENALSEAQAEAGSIFSSSYHPDNTSRSGLPMSDPPDEGHIDEDDEERRFNDQRKAMTDSRSQSQRVACYCDDSCTCRETGNCLSESVRVSAPSTEPPSSNRPSSSGTQPFGPPLGQDHETDYMSVWMADQTSRRHHDNIMAHEAARALMEHRQGDRQLNGMDPRRLSTAPTDCSGTTAFLSHDDLELSEPPPAPTPPLRSGLAHPPRPWTSGPPPSSRSVPSLPLRISTQNLRPPLEPLGERSSGSEHSQEQQIPFADSAVHTDSANREMPPQMETLDNVTPSNNPYRSTPAEAIGTANPHSDHQSRLEPTTPRNNHDEGYNSTDASSSSRPSPSSIIRRPNTY